MKIRRMLAGANHYFQGTDILDQVGKEAKDLHWEYVLILSGERAYAEAGRVVADSLHKHGINYKVELYKGHTTAAAIELYAEQCDKLECSGVIGVGGGKIMDLAKAVGALANKQVITVPTSAATCAAYAPLSIIYSEKGQQEEIRFHDREVDAVFVDLGVISRAPARLLAAGMADAMAKTCEYSSTHPRLHYGDIETAKYCGYCLAKSADEILLQCGSKAFQDVLEGRVSNELEDAVFASIAVIGIVSGLGGYTKKPGGRFAIAHGFNEVIRGRWEPDPRRHLHGEVVAVGILAQLYVNEMDETYIERVRDFFHSIQIPCTLHDLGMILNDEDLERFTEEVIQNSSIGSTHGSKIRDAIRRVR